MIINGIYLPRVFSRIRIKIFRPLISPCAKFETPLFLTAISAGISGKIRRIQRIYHWSHLLTKKDLSYWEWGDEKHFHVKPWLLCIFLSTECNRLVVRTRAINRGTGHICLIQWIIFSFFLSLKSKELPLTFLSAKYFRCDRSFCVTQYLLTGPKL